ncbi:MAG: IS21 family transposase [Candidatus Dormibacteria bacterium]
MSKVELYERIRRDHRDDGLGVRALARRYRVHRRAVREALVSAEPPGRKVAQRSSPALGPYQGIIREWLTADRAAPRKQRHTAHRVWVRLTTEHGASVSESTVRAHVAQVRIELAGAAADVMVPQTHLPGEQAEVDFGELWAWIDGVYTRLWMFCMRLSYSGRAFHLAFANQATEAFLEGHVEAFAYFGGVPAGHIRYDNLKTAVLKVLLGRERLENPRFVALRSHYGFDSFYCEPGIGGAHEKGGVEGEIGRFRRNHLVPVPEVGSLAELNARIAVADAADDARSIGRRAATVGAFAAEEAACLLALPDDGYDHTTGLSCVVDARARINVRQCYYSVPARFSRKRVDVRLGGRQLQVVHQGRVVATHGRLIHRGSEELVLDHYLEILAIKPGALAGSTPLAQARAAGAFGRVHDAFWDGARRSLGERDGTRALIGVLLLYRSLPADAVVAGMRAALRIPTVDPEVVAVEARRSLEPALAAVIPIGVRLCDRPAPSLGGYDTLLEGGGAQ